MRYQCPFCGSTNRKHDEIDCEEASWRDGSVESDPWDGDLDADAVIAREV